MAASGLMTFLPVYFGAEPPIGSNMLTPFGLMLPPAAMPMPPWIIAPRSVMMSPNMLSVTITSNRSGFLTIHMQVASTWAYSRLMSGKSRSPISWNARSQRSKA